MPELDRGLYEVLITEALDAQLGRLGGALEAIRDELKAPEAADRIGLHLARVVGQAISAIVDFRGSCQIRLRLVSHRVEGAALRVVVSRSKQMPIALSRIPSC